MFDFSSIISLPYFYQKTQRMYWKNYSIHIAKNILIKIPKRIIRFFSILGEFFRFRYITDGRFTVKLADMYPCTKDKLPATPFDQHYTYHPAWAARILAKNKPAQHIDISSILSFSSIVSAFVPVKFYDYRPAKLTLSGYESDFADLTQLPFPDDSIESLSCMHTVEHIGLGRYGDLIDPKGDIKAMDELKRVLKPGGTLLFVTPVGKPKIEFNAHRVYSFEMVINAFSPLHLQEFSLIPDAGGLIENAEPGLVAQQQYGCGCFWFKK
jgi:SAM-dependent methyltransferase